MDDPNFGFSHCELQEDNHFKCDENEKHNSKAEISIHNLPEGITHDGVTNLLLSVGTPLSVHFNPFKNLAYITLETLNQAELAIRDLHKQPPYNLSVALCQNRSNKLTKLINACKSQPEGFNSHDLSSEFVAEKITFEGLNGHFKGIEALKDEQTQYKKVNFTPSYKVHHKNCDFKVPFGPSICCGRGYFNMGNQERYVGGLQVSKYTSENLTDELSKCYFEEDFCCSNCNAPTTKICSSCLVSFCSSNCLNENTNHKGSDCFKGVKKASSVDTSNVYQRRQVHLESQCPVVITMYSSLDTVFVRRVDNQWEELFVKLQNDVAISELEETSLEELPVVGEVYCVRYIEDGCYYRGQILSVDDQKSMVYFLDFGNVQETDFGFLKPLKENLKKVPQLAVKLSLRDVPLGTSAEAVTYLNKLISENSVLILKFKDFMTDGVFLVEKDSGEIVNDKLRKMILPSWQKNLSILSKLGEVFYLEAIPNQTLAIGKTHNLNLSYVCENEFKENGTLWLINSEGDYFQYLNEEVKARMAEYCDYLKNDFYLPRESELCLARDNGRWQRCACLNSIGTTCWLFFIDDGKTSFIETKDIRKMIADFLECPQQAIRCVLSDYSLLKEDDQCKVFNYLQNMTSKTLNSVLIKNFENGDYQIVVSDIEKLLKEENM